MCIALCQGASGDGKTDRSGFPGLIYSLPLPCAYDVPAARWRWIPDWNAVLLVCAVSDAGTNAREEFLSRVVSAELNGAPLWNRYALLLGDRRAHMCLLSTFPTCRYKPGFLCLRTELTVSFSGTDGLSSTQSELPSTSAQRAAGDRAAQSQRRRRVTGRREHFASVYTNPDRSWCECAR